MRKQSRAFLESINEQVHLRWLILLGTTLVVALLLFPALWSGTPGYHIGDVAEKDIKSPKDFLVEDREATQDKREEASLSVLTVYDFDDSLASELGERVARAFHHMWTLSPASEGGNLGTSADGTEVGSQTLSKHDLIWKQKETFEGILGSKVSSEAYKILEENDFSEGTSRQIGRLLARVYQKGVVGSKELLLQQQQNGIMVRTLSSKEERLARQFEQFYSLDEARIALATAARALFKDVDYSMRHAMIDLSQRLIQPNLTLNKGETEERRAKAVEDVKAVLTQIKKGEMLVREGEKISSLHVVKLEALESAMGREDLFTISSGFMLLAVAFLVISFTTYFKTEASVILKNKDLLFLCVMLIMLFLLSEVSAFLIHGIARNIPYSIEASSAFYAIPVASGAMTVCLLLGMEVALPFAVATAFMSAFLFENRFEMFLFFLLSGMVGAYLVRNCTERGTLIKAGLKVGLVSMVVVTGLRMFTGSVFQANLVWDWAFGLLGGVSSGILTTGFTPVVEMTFAYTTGIKLLELANLDRPILRKLMFEAPGTYHHSVIVGSLGEAGAATIGANPLLAKVSGYYHDIGKITKPLYFIENQEVRKNRHDKLAPSMSSLILTSHVRDGVEIARRDKLGEAIVDIIQQHHGTSLITYFYEKAKKLKGEGVVNVEHFRYPGPKPQTKEAGLVLLADSVEAASRTLDNPTPARIKGLVKRIIDNAFLDGQLDESELTLKDLTKIADSFNKILNGIYHHRIEYPNGNTGAKTDRPTKKTNGDSDRRQTRSSQDRLRQGREQGAKNIERLRIS
jgi:putative nucleotidyltransferase with HDIG domain